MRLHAGLTSIAPPFPTSSNVLQNLVTPTFGNTSLVGPASSRSVMSAMVPFYLPALKLPMSPSSPKRPSLMSLILQWPGHYTSMDLSHVFVDPNPGFPQQMWPSARHGQLHTLSGLLMTGSRSYSQTSPNSCYSSQMDTNIAG